MQPSPHHELSGQSGAGPAGQSSFSATKLLPGSLSKNSKRSLGSTVAEDVNGHGDAHQNTPAPAANQLLRSSSFSKVSSSSVGSQLHSNHIRDQQPQQQQHGQQFQHQHTRATSHGGKNRSAPTNGQSEDLGTERAQVSVMGDGIVNQSMKEDLETWIAALGLAPEDPIHVVGYFGQCRDLSMFERVSPSAHPGDRASVYNNGCHGLPENSAERAPGAQLGSWTLGLGHDQTTGDIHLYVDRSNNTLMLQHAYLYDTQEMLAMCLESVDAVKKDRSSMMKWMHDQEFESHRALLFLFLVSQVVVHTSPDMNLDPKMISVLLALSTIKRQILQELDRFMTICWDRIGVPSPESQRNVGDQNGGSNASKAPGSMASIFTPGKCVPILVFVIERVTIATPWGEPGATETQLVEQLKQQLLKKSIDATQTRLRYVFRACRLIQSIDPPTGAFDTPSSTPFVHVIPYFTGRLNWQSIMIQPTLKNSEEAFDPAAAVMRQNMNAASGSAGGAYKKHGHHAKKHAVRETKERSSVHVTGGDGESSGPHTPMLREIYDTIVQAKDRPLSGKGPSHLGRKEGTEDGEESTPSLSLGALYLEYSGPLLRQFVDGWLKNVTMPGGYGNAVGKRNAGAVEIPSIQQWIAGYLGVCEALGISSLTPVDASGSEVLSAAVSGHATLIVGHDSSGDDGIGAKSSRTNIATTASQSPSGGGGRRSGNGKKYSQRCANMIQKKIQDYVQTDEVMEELYGQKPDLAVTRSHSERYHQLKADQATKLFQSLAHRR
ncbi:hypothetical protein BGZ67_004523 [Mortierella alpina]|nr:hypothetical protein BGZ67_004523 [Mortierella alpina]